MMHSIHPNTSALRIANGGLRIVPTSDSHWGFSLIELVISIAILVVGLVGGVRVFPIGLRASQQAELRSRATLAAQRTLESLKLKPWEALELGESTTHEDSFDIVVSIDQPEVEGIVDRSRLKRVFVSVRWLHEGRTRELSMVTYAYHPSS